MLPSFQNTQIYVCLQMFFVLVIFDLFNKVILKINDFSVINSYFGWGVNVYGSVLLFKDFYWLLNYPKALNEFTQNACIWLQRHTRYTLVFNSIQISVQQISVQQ